jgi:hypothetical protein
MSLDIPQQYALIIKLIIFQRWQRVRGNLALLALNLRKISRISFNDR